MRAKSLSLVIALGVVALVAPAHAGPVARPGLFQKAFVRLHDVKERVGQRAEIGLLKTKLAFGGMREGELRSLKKRTFYMGPGKERRERTIMEAVKIGNRLRLMTAVQVRYDRSEKGSYGSTMILGGRKMARDRNRAAAAAAR